MKARQVINKLRIKEGKLMDAYEKKYAALVYRAIYRQIEDYEQTQSIDDYTLFKEIEKLYLDVTPLFAKNQYKQLDSFNTAKSLELFLGVWDTWIKTWAQTNLAVKVKNINDTTRELIANIVAEGTNEGYTFDQISKQLLEYFKGDKGKNRAKMIARTEVGNAVNMGKKRSAEDWETDSGIEVYKMWIHRPSKEPRGWHYMLDDNKGYPKNHLWTVTIPKGNTDLMDTPHDPNASAGNVINCACTVQFVSRRFAERLNRNQ